jgi:hypothetical protein
MTSAVNCRPLNGFFLPAATMSPLSALSRHSPSTGSFKAATEPIKADRGNLRHGSDPLRFLDLLILARPTLVEGAIHDITLTGIGRIEANSVVLIASSSNLGRDFPFRHGVEAVKMGGKSGAVGARWDEEVPDGGEHRGEPGLLHGSVGDHTESTRRLWFRQCGRAPGIQARACGSKRRRRWRPRSRGGVQSASAAHRRSRV